MEFEIGVPISETEVLKWNMSKSKLFKLGKPEVSASRMFARWKNINLFEGENVNITTEFLGVISESQYIIDTKNKLIYFMTFVYNYKLMNNIKLILSLDVERTKKIVIQIISSIHSPNSPSKNSSKEMFLLI